jgi:hypothetical protein
VLKFLIDECLSLDLVGVARDRGFTQSSHVVWLGKAGWKDWQLKPFILDGDWTFVTRDRIDFRGPAEHPGTKGQYAGVALHAGLVCMNGPAGMNLELQCELFSAALDEIGNADQLVNEVIEVDMETAVGEITIRRYTLSD